MKTLFKIVIISVFITASSVTLACDAAGPMAHIGQVTAVDTGKGTFTIMDAETRSAITFHAGKDIIDGLKGVKGMVKVNYEEDGSDLNALGVVF